MQQRLLPVGTILLVILWTARCVAGQPLISPEVHKQLDMPEGQLDIGIAALTIAKEVYLELDIPAYSRKLDTLADKVRWLAKGTRDPEQRIRVLNTALFRYEGFHYDRAPFSRSKQTYYFLNGILDTKQGICITMPLLYIAVAQRLGYPIYPVAAPDHMFVRYVDTSFKQQNIETTSGGKYFSDQEYIEDFFVSAKALKSGGYMRTMTYREFLAHILVASAFAFRGNGHKQLAYVEKAVTLDPRFPDFYLSLGEGYLAKSKIVRGPLVEAYRDKGMRYTSKAKELGFVGLEDVAAGRQTRGK